MLVLTPALERQTTAIWRVANACLFVFFVCVSVVVGKMKLLRTRVEPRAGARKLRGARQVILWKAGVSPYAPTCSVVSTAFDGESGRCAESLAGVKVTPTYRKKNGQNHS